MQQGQNSHWLLLKGAGDLFSCLCFPPITCSMTLPGILFEGKTLSLVSGAREAVLTSAPFDGWLVDRNGHIKQKTFKDSSGAPVEQWFRGHIDQTLTAPQTPPQVIDVEAESVARAVRCVLQDQSKAIAGMFEKTNQTLGMVTEVLTSTKSEMTQLKAEFEEKVQV